MNVTLSVDVMGGDNGIKVTIPACIKILHEIEDISFILVGNKQEIINLFHKDLKKYSNRIEIVHSEQVVTMDDSPQSAMRNKQDSSMWHAINLVKENRSGAIVSAGNTGALMALSRYILKTIGGISRPAIAKLLPTISGKDVCMLDLGANIECSPEQLIEFGILGSQFMNSLSHIENPLIGILNIGVENIKGSDTIKRAISLFKDSELNFYGSVEGNDINKGVVDVIVCDGFTGNVALKTLEGVANMINSIIKKEFKRSLFSKLIALCAYPVLNRIKNQLDARKYNGAVLLGLNGLVIKSHGGTDAIGFYYALKQAYLEVKFDFISKLQNRLNKIN